MRGREMVEAVRAAAGVLKTTWEMKVLNRFMVDLSSEPIEEAAYAELAAEGDAARTYLRDLWHLDPRPR